MAAEGLGEDVADEVAGGEEDADVVEDDEAVGRPEDSRVAEEDGELVAEEGGEVELGGDQDPLRAMSAREEISKVEREREATDFVILFYQVR